MIVNALRNIIEENREVNKGFLRNLLKEYLELTVLEFVYNSRYSSLIFKGGSSLRVCFSLPRLSEDLDFDYEERFEIEEFFNDLIVYIKREKNTPQIEVKANVGRLYLKFPILRQLNAAGQDESDKLYLKIELAPVKKCLFKTASDPVFKEGFSFLVRRYSIEDLMAGKICAVLNRVWFKGKKNEVKVKGRDFFDLYWFMKQKVIPNYQCIFYQEKNLSSAETWTMLQERVEQVNLRDIEYDLQPLLREQKFVQDFSRNFKELFADKISFYRE